MDKEHQNETKDDAPAPPFATTNPIAPPSATTTAPLATPPVSLTDMIDSHYNVVPKQSTTTTTATSTTTPTTTPFHKMKTVATLRAHLDTVRDISFHPTRPLAVSVADDGMVKIWNLRKVKRAPDLRSAILNEPVRTCYSHQGPALCVDANADLCCTGGSDGTVRIWNMVREQDEDIRLRKGPSTSKERATYKHSTSHVVNGHTDAVWSVALLRHDSFVSVSADGTARVWNFSHQRNRNSGTQEMYRHQTTSVPTSVVVPTKLSPLPPHHAWVGCRNGSVVQIDCQQGCAVSEFGTHDQGDQGDQGDGSNVQHLVHTVALHPTMSLALVAKHDGTVVFYDPRVPQAVQVHTAHASPTTAVACEPMGLMYATGCSDGDVRVWDLRTVSGVGRGVMIVVVVSFAAICNGADLVVV